MGAVAIVGGGIAGLTAAYRLKQRGTRVVVYEASDRVGGTILTERREGYLADLGPNSLAAPAPRWRALCSPNSGWRPAWWPRRRRHGRYVVRKNKLVPAADVAAGPAHHPPAVQQRQARRVRRAAGGRGRLAGGGERRRLRSAAVQPGSPRLRRQSVRRRNLRRRSRAALGAPRAAQAVRARAQPRLGA